MRGKKQVALGAVVVVSIAVIVACGGSELSRPSSQISTSVDDDAAVGDVVDASAELDSAAVDDADVATPDASAIPVHDGGPACSAAAPYCAPGFYCLLVQQHDGTVTNDNCVPLPTGCTTCECAEADGNTRNGGTPPCFECWDTGGQSVSNSSGATVGLVSCHWD